MTAFMWLATCAWGLLVAGYFFRFNRKRHFSLMISGIFCDIFLVLYLQVTRDAIQTAISFSLTILKQIHIGFSTIALLLYFPVLFLGYKLYTNTATPKQRMLNIRLATAALVAPPWVLFLCSLCGNPERYRHCFGKFAISTNPEI